jgi:hypothetical protein
LTIETASLAGSSSSTLTGRREGFSSACTSFTSLRNSRYSAACCLTAAAPVGAALRVAGTVWRPVSMAMISPTARSRSAAARSRSA